MRWRTGLVILGCASGVAARWMSYSRPDRKPDWIIGLLLLLPFVLLSVWAFHLDTRGPRPARWFRATLFAFLVVDAFYWGITFGGIAAAVGAIAVYTRLIRPRPTAASGPG